MHTQFRLSENFQQPIHDLFVKDYTEQIIPCKYDNKRKFPEYGDKPEERIDSPGDDGRRPDHGQQKGYQKEGLHPRRAIRLDMTPEKEI
jgi:hypothetical protein